MKILTASLLSIIIVIYALSKKSINKIEENKEKIVKRVKKFHNNIEENNKKLKERANGKSITAKRGRPNKQTIITESSEKAGQTVEESKSGDKAGINSTEPDKSTAIQQ